MNHTFEKWALIVMLPAACVLLVGTAVDHDWVGTAAWALVAAFAGLALRRRSRRRA